MEQYNVIASFVHGNALGVVLEPGSAKDHTDAERRDTWQVRIGPLVAEAAVGAEYPAADYAKVVADLVKFCRKRHIQPRGLDNKT